jgi:hypothetical protein
MKTTDPSLFPSPLRRDRRGSPRVEARNHVLGRLVASGAAARVVDVGFGGFQLETDAPFEIGTLHQIRLYTAVAGVDVVVTGCVVYSRRDSTAARRSRYLSGFSLAGPHHWDSQAQYDRLLDAVADPGPEVA